MEKNIYIILSQTNTLLGKLIRYCSLYPYNHISISTNKSLQPLYSFARYNYNSPLVGGFVEESPLRYLFYNKNVKVRIYSIKVTQIQFEKFESILTSYLKNNSNYTYDTFSVFCGSTYQSPYKQTCISFAVSILKDLRIFSSDTTPRTIKSFAMCLSSFPYVDTIISNNSNTAYVWGNDKYYQKIPIKQVIKDTFHHFLKLLS